MASIDFAAVKDRHGILEVLERLGVEPPARWLANDACMVCCPAPNHEDRTPSCIVLTQTNRFKCFGCGEHGDVLDLVQLATGCRSAAEAAVWLDGDVRVHQSTWPAFGERHRPRSDGGGPQLDRTARDQILEVNQLAWGVLTEEPRRSAALLYVHDRGIEIDAIERRAGGPLVGYPPAGRDGLRAQLRASGVSDDELIDAGWAIRREGQIFDRLHRRAVFAIRNELGQVVGYTARDMTGTARSKYINTPTTAAFVKGSSLYAPLGFVRHLTVAVCEGPFDALALCMEQTNVPLAVLGTQLTPGHVSLIARAAPRSVHVLADGDPAGSAAAARWARALVDAGLNAAAITCPPGSDPASHPTLNLVSRRFIDDLGCP